MPYRGIPPRPPAATSACPACEQPLKLNPALIGCRIRCLGCHAVLEVNAETLAAPGWSDRLAVAVVVPPQGCPTCGQYFRLVPGLEGQRIRCTGCGEVLVVAVSQQPPASAADEEAERLAPVERNGQRAPLSRNDKGGPKLRAAGLASVAFAGQRATRVTPGEPNGRQAPVLPKARGGKADRPVAFDRDGGRSAKKDPLSPSAGNGMDELVPFVRNGRPAPIVRSTGGDAVDRPVSSQRNGERNGQQAPLSRSNGSDDADQPATVERGLGWSPTAVEELAVSVALDGDAESLPAYQPPALLFPEPTANPSLKPVRSPGGKPALSPDVKPKAGHMWDVGPTHEHGHSKKGSAAWQWIAAGIAAGLAALVLLSGLVAMIWWLFASGPPACPPARWMPEECEWFASFKWAELSATVPEVKDLPGLAFSQRCRIFVENAGLQAGDIERITVGRPAGKSGMIIVYALTKPVTAAQIMALPAFVVAHKKSGDNEQTIRGVPIFEFETSAIAFPDPRTIISGETELLRSVLERGAVVRDPMNRLIRAADFSTTGMAVTVGVPRPFVEDYLGGHDSLAEMIVGTTDQFQFGATNRLSRTFYFDDPAMADEFQRVVRTSLAVHSTKLPSHVRKLVDMTEITRAECKVSLRLSGKFDVLAKDVREVLGRLF